MGFNMSLVGKVVSIDYKKGIGEIVSANRKYIFLTEDVLEGKEINIGDLVEFRSEQVHNTYKAYFVRLLSIESVRKYQKETN